MSEAMLEYLLDSHGIDVLDGPVDGLDAGERERERERRVMRAGRGAAASRRQSAGACPVL
jgi:hypothetical protein